MGRRVLRLRLLAATGAALGACVTVVWVLTGGALMLGLLAGVAVCVALTIPMLALGDSPSVALRNDPDIAALMDAARSPEDNTRHEIPRNSL